MAELFEQFDSNLYLRDDPVRFQLKNDTYDIDPDRIISGDLSSSVIQMAGGFQSGKTDFTNTETGYIIGLDSDIPKFFIGDSDNYFNFDGSNVDLSGSLVAADGTLGSLTIASGGNIKQGQTDYNTGSGFWLGDDGGTTKFSIGDGTTANSLTWDGSSLSIGGVVLESKGSFGGDGSDGALSITSGTTTIDLGNAAVVIKNYTSISITGTGKLAFSNPNANGTLIILKSQGNVVLTSSTTPLIDLTDIGASGGTGSVGAAGGNGSDNDFILDSDNHFGIGGNPNSGLNGGAAPAAGVIYTLPNFYLTSATILERKVISITCGNGGAAGGGSIDSGSNPDSAGGDGGRGGGGLYIECGGAWNFTGTIDASGSDGQNGTFTGGATNGGTGGGAGGSGGMVVALYNSLTANSGTITVSGGDGGDGGNGFSDGATNAGAGSGGSSSGNHKTAGVAGGKGGNAGINGTNGSTPSGGGTGGTGGTQSGGRAGGGGGGAGGPVGSYLITQNTVFA